MNKYEILTTLKAKGLVAVIRGETKEDALQQANACIAGGITIIEIAFTTPDASTVIHVLNREYQLSPDVIIGAGTVLDAETARIAILEGAQFVVTPYFSKAIMKLCNRYRIPCMPGASTIQGIVEALEYGADIIKVFPGEVVGKQMIKAARGPLPQAELMPTGGVSLENIHEWLSVGAVAVGIGGALSGKGKSTEEITALAHQFVEKWESYHDAN